VGETFCLPKENNFLSQGVIHKKVGLDFPCETFHVLKEKEEEDFRFKNNKLGEATRASRLISKN